MFVAFERVENQCHNECHNEMKYKVDTSQIQGRT